MVINVETYGAKAALTLMREELQKAIGREVECINGQQWIADSEVEIRRDAAGFFRDLLATLREELIWPEEINF